MRQTTSKIFVLVLILLVSILLGNGVSLAAFTDIDNNWAREAILSLNQKELFKDILEDEFGPHSSLTHETALELVARAFELTEDDQEKLGSWLNKNLVPDSVGITRGEFAALIANPLGLGEQNTAPSGWYPSFVDLNSDYPGFVAIEVLQRLALLPSHMLGRFEPYRLITRSEMASILNEALKLEEIKGVITKVEENNQISVQKEEESPEITVQLLAETLYVAPQGLTRGITKDHKFEQGDQIRILMKNQKALLANVEQEQTVQVLLQGLNQVTKTLADILTPAQISALVAGDWEQLNEEVRYEVYEELVDRGVAPWEADALLKQDWASLQTMAEERLTQEAADYLQITPEMIHAAISQDWTKLLEYAQVELAERLLTSDWLKATPKN